MAVKLKTEFHPIRLAKDFDEYTTLIVNLFNESDKDLIISVETILPPDVLLGFDPRALKKKESKEITLRPFEEKEIYFNIYATRHTNPGTYPVLIKINFHADKPEAILYTHKRVVKLKVI